MNKFPLLVQFEYHPASKEAASIAEQLHHILNDDPAVPGLRIPTCFTPDDGTLTPPAARIATEADRVLVVLLADDTLAANARRPAISGSTWGDYVVRLRELCESSQNSRFMPIQITEHARPVASQLEDLSFLQAWTINTSEDRCKFIARRIIHLLIRRLRPHELGDDAPALTIFLSHTKLDVENEPKVVKEILAYLTATQPEKTWFDSGDIASGSRFAKEIEKGVQDSALLAIVTDSYSSRSWCRREVLLAKRFQRPVVIVDAVQQREIRRFPYVGNVPVIRWKNSPQEVVDLLLRETLRHAYSEEYLKQRKRPEDEILPTGPELVTLVHRDRNISILYPDPPLGAEELAVLEATGIRVETPLERHAQQNCLAEKSLVVSLSISESEDISRYGLRRTHLDSILLELSRYLLLSGVRLAYGGHLGPKGYTISLADLLYDPILEQIRGQPLGGQPKLPQLVSYLAWPMWATAQDEARMGLHVDVRQCERPIDVDEALDPALVSSPVNPIPVDSAVKRYGWSRGLTEMRNRQTSETNARIVIGGKIGSAHSPYNGRMPGVLEETLLSIQHLQPVYLIGAFGGCARLIIDALEGVSRSELSWEHQSFVPHSVELRSLYLERQKPWDEYKDIFALLQARGMGGLNNGLNADENRELASTRSPERIVELVLSGLKMVYTKNPSANEA